MEDVERRAQDRARYSKVNAEQRTYLSIAVSQWNYLSVYLSCY